MLFLTVSNSCFLLLAVESQKLAFLLMGPDSNWWLPWALYEQCSQAVCELWDWGDPSPCAGFPFMSVLFAQHYLAWTPLSPASMCPGQEENDQLWDCGRPRSPFWLSFYVPSLLSFCPRKCPCLCVGVCLCSLASITEMSRALGRKSLGFPVGDAPL